jgi:N-carbamoylputrescine amidase
MTEITVAALQLAFSNDIDANIANVSRLVREAAGQGASVILPPELFEGEYFCRVEDEGLFANAAPVGEHKSVLAMQALAEALKVTIPTSFFEADGPHYYNSLAMIGPDGEVQGVYRKSHIPDGPGYEEKFYFRPGNTGFKVWPAPQTAPGWTLGVGVCWDQWYPETARAMMLMGAELLFYPTAIGSEPHDTSLDTARLWRRAMVGHAVSNVVPIVAANDAGRHGHLDSSSCELGPCVVSNR